MQALQETLILKQRCDVEKRGPALASPRRQQSLVERVCRQQRNGVIPVSPVIMWNVCFILNTSKCGHDSYLVINILVHSSAESLATDPGGCKATKIKRKKVILLGD